MTEAGGIGFPVPEWLKAALRWASFAMLLVALAYLALAFARLDIAGVAARLGQDDWLLSGAGALGYAGLLALLAQGWSGDAGRPQRPDWAVALAVYGPGVVAKYIPGSVFQYASRQVLGARAGWQHGAMARASLFEAAVHVPAALGVASALLLTGSVWGLAPLLLAGVALHILGRGARIAAVGLQLTFFAGFGVIITWLASGALGLPHSSQLAGLFMLAWVAGFLVPIAPGGLGVRESALLVLAAPLADPETIAVFAILTRLVTTAGDAIFGLVAYSIVARTRLNRQASA